MTDQKTITDQKTVVDRVLDMAHKIGVGPGASVPPTPRILEAPPSEAHEVTQPLTADARRVPASHRGNEKALAPLTYTESMPFQGVTTAAVTGPAAPAVPATVRPVVPAVPTTLPAPVAETLTTAVAPDLRAAAAALSTVEADAAAVIASHQPLATVAAPVPTGYIAPPEPYQPAASATDSPTRGLPTPARDPSLQPTGGFGPAPGVQYNPLDGSEVRELVLRLFDQIATQIATDLRFVRALTYPRLECRVMVDIATFPPEGAVRITKILPDPPGQLPRAVALQHADECCFVVMAGRQEMTADGVALDPPDKLRDELHLPKPHLQVVGTGVSRQMVDVAAERQFDVNGMPIVAGEPMVTAEPLRHAASGAGAVPRVTPGAEMPPRPVNVGPG